jgi:hypothetical protein
VHQFKIIYLYLYYYLYIIYIVIYIKTLRTIYVTIYSCMMEEIRIPIHKQIVQLYILNTYGDVMQNKIIVTR